MIQVYAIILVVKKTFRNTFIRLYPYISAFCCTLLILGLHMLPSMDSMLNENNTEISHVFLKSQIDYHKEIAPFARRPLTTFLIEGSSDVFGLKSGYAFILVNFFLLFLSGIFIYHLSKRLSARNKEAHLNMLVYFSSFSILFVFFPPVFTYDEPLQYCFILTALIALVRKSWLGYITLFTLALITRETSILILPALVIFFPGMKKATKDYLNYVLRLLSPLLLYSIFMGIYIWKNRLVEATRTEMASRYTCFLENFESMTNTVESLTSIFLTLGPFLYFSFFYLIKKPPYDNNKRVVFAFLLTVAINTPIVIFTAFARESRLFALPLLFIWPMFMQLFGPEVKSLFTTERYKAFVDKWWKFALFLMLMLLNYSFCFKIYQGLGLGEHNYFPEYLFLMNTGLIFHLTTSPFGISKKRA